MVEDIQLSTKRKLEQLALVTAAVLLALGCLLVLRPFFSAVLWALILALATWPALELIEARLKVTRVTASLLLTCGLLFACVAPLALVGWNLADNVTRLSDLGSRMVENGPPEAPTWLAKIPYVGERLALRWDELIHDRKQMLLGLRSLLSPAKDVLLASGAFIGQAVFQFVVSLFLLFFFYRDGEMFLDRLNVGASKIAGERSRHLLRVAGGTLQSAIYGIVGTAFAQGVLGGIGYLMAGVPAPFLLGIFTFVLSPIPVGPPLIWGGATIWLFSQGDPGWAVFLLLWGLLVVSSVDNFLKPYLISRGSDLPLVLILLGVMGGALAFGALGVFLGPALLAVAYTVLREWSEKSPEESMNSNSRL